MSYSDSLARSLNLRQSQLIGCTRQRRLDSGDSSWRMARGNALCALLAYKVSGSTPIDEFDVFVNGADLYTYRGGVWKEWWKEDIILLAALVKLYINEELNRIVVLHEVDNRLTDVYLNPPTSDEASDLVQAALNQWRVYGRIPKDSQRAAVLCKFCPVKRQCDALDLEKGETSDWPRNYPVG